MSKQEARRGECIPVTMRLLQQQQMVVTGGLTCTCSCVLCVSRCLCGQVLSVSWCVLCASSCACVCLCLWVCCVLADVCGICAVCHIELFPASDESRGPTEDTQRKSEQVHTQYWGIRVGGLVDQFSQTVRCKPLRGLSNTINPHETSRFCVNLMVTYFLLLNSFTRRKLTSTPLKLTHISIT